MNLFFFRYIINWIKKSFVNYHRTYPSNYRSRILQPLQIRSAQLLGSNTQSEQRIEATRTSIQNSYG